MDEIIEELMQISERLDKTAAEYRYSEWLKSMSKLFTASDRIAHSNSGSWLGRQANYYYKDFATVPTTAHFSLEWGPGSYAKGDWESYGDTDVVNAIYKLAGVTSPWGNEHSFQKAYAIHRSTVNEMKSILSTLESAFNLDSYTREAISQSKESRYISSEEYIARSKPTRAASRDAVAAQQGIRTPVYFQMKAAAAQALSLADDLEHKSLLCLDLAKHLRRSKRMAIPVRPSNGNKVFIGHGHSEDWRILKDLLQDRLRLEPDEFNRSSSAGMTTKERLEEMLDHAVFAFLVMTPEDELADGKMQARMNVIHEIGLFQGRLGFRKAIVVMEEGCEEFSNISGLVQIRYAKGNMPAKFEEIRKVLEREQIIK